MPYINLKLVGKLNKEQKEQIAKEFSDTLLKVAGKPKESLYLVIDEVNGENWAQGEKFFKQLINALCIHNPNYSGPLKQGRLVKKEELLKKLKPHIKAGDANSSTASKA